MSELYPATGWLKAAEKVLDGTATYVSASDLPKDAPGLEVEPLEPAEEPVQPAPNNAQIQGDDLTGPDAA